MKDLTPYPLGILSADLPASPESKGWRAGGGLFFQFRPETEKDKKHPENPVNPVKDKSLAEKTIEDVLLHFGETQNVARRRYREFVEKGIGQGRRVDKVANVPHYRHWKG